MRYDKLARFDARKTIGAAKDAVKGYAGNVSGGRYRKLQQQASALEGELGQLLNAPKMNPKRGAKIKELRDAIAGMNPEIVAAKKARNYTRAGTGGALGLAGGGIAMSKTEKKANYIGGEPAGGYQMSRPITDLLKEAAFGKAVARGAKTYWGNLSGKAYRAARTASGSAASIYGKPDTRLVNTMAQAKKVRNLTRAGTGVGMGVAIGGGIGLKNNLKTAGQIGPYGNEEQSQQALSDVYRGMGRGALIGAGKGAIGGGAFGTLAGGMMTKGTGRGFARGAMAGAVVGALSHAAYGAYKGGIAGGVHGAKKYSRKGLEEQRRIHGVKTAGFDGIAPFKPKPEEDYGSFNNYAREYGNRAVGGLAGGAAGALPGGVLAAAGGLARKRGLAAAGGVVAALGAIAGAYYGDNTSLRKTERLGGRKETTLGQYAGRIGAGALGGSVLPMVGHGAADYYVSRKMQKRD
jgi:hypothetical protein